MRPPPGLLGRLRRMAAASACSRLSCTARHRSILVSRKTRTDSRCCCPTSRGVALSRTYLGNRGKWCGDSDRPARQYYNPQWLITLGNQGGCHAQGDHCGCGHRRCCRGVDSGSGGPSRRLASVRCPLLTPYGVLAKVFALCRGWARCGRWTPCALVLRQLANGLRTSAQLLYAQVDAIAGRRRCSVPSVIRADVTITKRQRQVLIDVYEAFRRQSPDGTPPGGTTLHSESPHGRGDG